MARVDVTFLPPERTHQVRWGVQQPLHTKPDFLFKTPIAQQSLGPEVTSFIEANVTTSSRWFFRDKKNPGTKISVKNGRELLRKR